tara:strand:- start:1084 stop:1254 length:171 start_codon:yes stop_codon:yes gene_type:complete
VLLNKPKSTIPAASLTQFTSWHGIPTEIPELGRFIGFGGVCIFNRFIKFMLFADFG